MVKTILVTGGNGMMGRTLQPLLPDAIYLSRKDGDLRRTDDVDQLFAAHRPTHVVHLAARVGGVKENAQFNAEFLSDNLLIDANVLAAARRAGVNRVLTLLSACAFPFRPDRPSTEGDLHTGLPYEGNLGTGMAKRVLEVQCRLMSTQDGISCTTLTPVTMYGPHDRFDAENSHVVGALIHKVVRSMETGEPFQVWGDGSAVRQFVYAADVARILARLIDSDDTDHFIVAADDGMPIQTLAETIARMAGFAGQIKFLPKEPAGVPRKLLKSVRFHDIFPDFKFTPLEEGLRRTIEWYRSVRVTGNG